MKTAEFNQDYELDRKTRAGIRAADRFAGRTLRFSAGIQSGLRRISRRTQN